MKTIFSLTCRNFKIFFKDKGLFFSSLITPIILLVLYTTFLSGIYEDSFLSALPPMVEMDQGVLQGLVGGQLLSSLLAVSSITVSFCANMVMVNDKVNHIKDDLLTSPLKKPYLAISYYLATFLTTLLILFVALIFGYIYIAISEGFFFQIQDILWMSLDLILLTMFGTAFSSFINYFLSSQGQISAVSAIIGAGYGFICGAYMPIASFNEGLQKILMFLPGTYGTSLIRNHTMNASFEKLKDTLPSFAIEKMKDSIDVNIYFFDQKIELSIMYIVLIIATILFLGLYIGLYLLEKYHKRKA